MKACPICHARAFDDAEVCYGCLHRFASEVSPSAQTAPQGASSVEEGLAKIRSAMAATRPSVAPQPAPCPFGGGPEATATARAASALRGESVGAARPLEAPPFDGGGWTVRFEFPGFGPVGDPGGAIAQTGCAQGAGAEGFVVSLRPRAAAAPDPAPDPSRGVHARTEERPLLKAVTTAPEES